MGTPEFAVPSLQKLIEADFDIRAVYTQPPRPAGRGHNVQYSPVHLFALAHNLTVLTPLTLKETQTQEDFKHHDCDFAVVAAYGLILPRAILDMPKRGCINIHGSILPSWRGAAPIQRAILAGDTTTGVTMMHMDEGLDTGDILLEKTVPITSETTSSSLYKQLAHLGADHLEMTLQGLKDETLVARPQSQEGVTHAAKISKQEALLDWRKTAQHLACQIRAFDVWPGSFFEHQGQKIKVLKAVWEPLPVMVDPVPLPGQILDAALLIACGEGALRLIELQRPGKSPCHVKDFLNGTPMAVGLQLSLPDAAL